MLRLRHRHVQDSWQAAVGVTIVYGKTAHAVGLALYQHIWYKRWRNVGERKTSQMQRILAITIFEYMNTTRIVSVFLIPFLFAGVASAQTYSVVGGGTITPAGCISITHDLVRGSTDASTGGDVSRVQSFLAAQDYPGGGSWMITGFFGAATQQAVAQGRSQ